MIKARGLGLEIDGKRILKDITFTIEKGKFVAIIGPNGAGKTTLVKIILGIINPTEGSVLLKDLPPKELLKKNPGIVGYLPQRAIVNWNMPLKVIDVVLIEKLYPFGFFRKHKREDLERAIFWLDVFGMKQKMNAYIRNLSGGEQQRVSLARCMMNEPEILILDEPNTAVDAVYNVKIYETLRKLCDEKDITVVMVTHDIGAVTQYVDEIMCLNVKLHCHGSPAVINYSEMLRVVYGENMNIVIHGEQCKNCVIGKGNDATNH